MHNHLGLHTMRGELLESRLALAGPVLETRQKKMVRLRTQVSDGCVGAV